MKLLYFTAGCLLGISTYAAACTTGINLKVDRVTLNSPVGGTTGPTTVNFRQSYTSTPLVFILPSNDNADPATIRILSVGTTGFQVGTAESEGEDGATTVQSFNYIAIEAGSYTPLFGGPSIQAGSINTTQRQSGAGDTTGYATANFSPSFGGTPTVLHEIQSFSNDPTYNFSTTALTQPWLETISLQASATVSSVPIALERAETSAGSVAVNETIAWFAIDAGSGSFSANGNTINYNAFSTAQNINENCTSNAHGLASINTIAIANQSSRAGNNGGWLRLCNTDSNNISMKIQEDRANDPEVGHASESATVVAYSQAFDLAGSAFLGIPKMEVASATVNAQNVGGSLTFTSVSFPNAFQSTPLIFALPTTEGTAPASVRLRNITTTGFQVAQVEPQGEAGAHPSMTIDYLAVTPGTHTFPNGTTMLEAGSISSSAFQGRNNAGTSYSTLTFNNTFTANPAFLLGVQSTNSEPGINPSTISAPWLEVTVESGSITTNSARIAMERAETSNGTVSAETIAYIAAETSINDIITSNGGGPISVKTMTTPNNIKGYDNGCFTNNFNGGAFAATPYVIAQQISRNGADGGWLRRCNINSTQIGLTVDEDRANDSERAHTSETAAVFAFENAFEWCPPLLNLSKNSMVVRDLINGTSNPKAIPGALQTYSLRLNNEGRIPLDNNKVVLSDSIPAGTSIFVQSSASYPEIPFTFIDGAGAAISGLSFVYTAPASNTDDVEFSNNNGTDFLYTPTPDGDGFDSAVTDVRINPKGIFNASNGTDIPTFTLELSVRVD